MIKEIDINPLLASPERLIALDARILLHEPVLEEEKLPRFCDPTLPGTVCQQLDLTGWRRIYDPPHSARR
ncbi:MAG: hypothetical protein R2867_23735 [Caldilineaceae bacterium]